MKLSYIFRSIIVLLLSSLDPLWSQEEKKQKTYLITLSPLALADVFDGASVRPGFEMQLNNRFSAGMETGFYLPYLNATKIKPKGFVFKPMLRYWLHPKKENNYIALEYMFKQQDYRFKDSLEISENRFEKQYSMKRHVHALSVRYGRMKQLGKNFVLDCYAGIGIRHIHSSSDLSPAESDAILSGSSGDCPLQQDILRITGSHLYPNFLLGVRIGYRL